MGNHDAGRQVVATVQTILKRRTTETALQVLDEAVDALYASGRYSRFHGVDAEFDDAEYPDGELFDLLVEAFAPGERFALDTGGRDWDEDGFYNRVIVPFHTRYNFW